MEAQWYTVLFLAAWLTSTAIKPVGFLIILGLIITGILGQILNPAIRKLSAVNTSDCL